MNERREKAIQGKGNGGFTAYGYALKDDRLVIEEYEAEAIRIIYERSANSDLGYGKVARYLNLQGIKKFKDKTVLLIPGGVILYVWY